MKLVFVGSDNRPFFPPDCMDNIRNDDPRVRTTTVFDRAGVPICGFVAAVAEAPPVGYRLLRWEYQ